MSEITYMYDNQKNRIYGKNLPVHLFGSSSSGNSVYLELINLLIDLGLPFKRYHDFNPNFFNNVKYVILTHEHGDHLNPATLKKLITNYPNIKFFITNRLLTQILHLPRINTKVSPDLIRSAKDRFILINELDTGIFANGYDLTSFHGSYYKFKPYLTEHGDLTNIAIDIEIKNPKRHVLYASDLDTFEPRETIIPNNFYDPNYSQNTPILLHTQGLPQVNQNELYDVILLEANYDRDIVEHVISHNSNLLRTIKQKEPNNITAIKALHNIITKALGNKRHISEQQAWSYVERHLKADGAFIPLHASSTYGTLIQKTDNTK